MTLNTTAEPFIPGTIPFQQYLEQLEWMFIHNEYNEDRYKASFLAVCGTEVYSQIRLLFPGRSLKDLTYKQITDELKKRYDKKESDVIQSYKFWTRRQGQYEKSIDFVLAVKQLAEECDFGAFKDRAIRDVLVIGINDKQLQKRLFDEDDLTATKAEKIIVNQEKASENAGQVLGRSAEKNVGIVARLGRRNESSRFRSRFRGRSRSYDRYRSRSRSGNGYDRGYDKGSGRKEKPLYLCSYCKKTGHTRKYCYRLKERSPQNSKSNVKFVDSPKPGSSGLFKRLKVDMETDDEEETLGCLMISSVNKISEPCYVEPKVERKYLKMEIDCGSAESVISEKAFLREFKHCMLEKCSKLLVVIDGNRLKVLGKFTVLVQLNKIQHYLQLVVLSCDNDFVPLLGRSWLDVFYPTWRSTFLKPALQVGRIDADKEGKIVNDIKNFSRW